MNCVTQPLHWAIFCRVIDNFGDAGVCWRLARDLAQRGHSVQLWLDDPQVLDWMAPEGCAGVQVLAWHTPWAWPLDKPFGQVDVMVEGFGCEIAPEFIAKQAGKTLTTGYFCQELMQKPVWINLEYLSAEPYVERCHGLASLQSGGPGAGWKKWFFYPGFTALTGGLLREPDLSARHAGFDKTAWLAAHGLPTTGEKRISVFCYEPAALPALLMHWAQHALDGEPVRLLVAAGRATAAVQHAVAQCVMNQNASRSPHLLPPLLLITYLPLLTQTDFDHLLWACDLNFVRGEDSLVRAIWAGKPWVWHIYPQADGAHLVKLQALLDRLKVPASVQALHHAWNASAAVDNAVDSMSRAAPVAAATTALSGPDWAAWQAFAHQTREELGGHDDLTCQLQRFAAGKKS